MTSVVRRDDTETCDGVVSLVLDSPHNRNALSRALVTQLLDQLEELADDRDVRVVLIRSAGKVFCSGADLSEAHHDGMEQASRLLVELQRRIVALPQPVLAVVEGPVRAGGIGVVAACDLAIATDDATFAFTEARLGLAPAVISLTVQSRLSERNAALTFLGAEVFDGRRAHEIGLVTTSVPRTALAETLTAVIGSLTTAVSQGLRETKALLNRDLVGRIDEQGAAMAALSARLFASPEGRAAIQRFLTATR